MAKKPKFPLVMNGDERVRSVEELRQHFSTARVLTYLNNGKLATWLRDRNAAELAEAVEQLDKADAELPRKITELFGVAYDERMAAAFQRESKLERLKQYTENEEILRCVDTTAFNQSELDALLSAGMTEINLCGDSFRIPLSYKHIIYCGINNPIVTLDPTEIRDWNDLGIILRNVRYDDEYVRAFVAAQMAQWEQDYGVTVQGYGENKDVIFEDKRKNSIKVLYRNVPYAHETTTKVFALSIGARTLLRVFDKMTAEEMIAIPFFGGKTAADFRGFVENVIDCTQTWLVVRKGKNTLTIGDLRSGAVRNVQSSEPEISAGLIMGDNLYLATSTSPSDLHWAMDLSLPKDGYV